VLPQNAVPQSPPETFKEANRMVQDAWKVVFPSLRFPSELIVFKIPAPPKIGVPDIQLGNGVVIHDVPMKYEFVVDSNLARFRRERGLVTALKDVPDQKTNRPSQHAKHLLAAFAASHPQILFIYQELLIALARYTFLLEIKACIDNNGKAKIMDVSFMNLKNVANCSPSCSSLTNWVTELAKDQYLIFSRKMDNANVFCQSDEGQKGQEVSIFYSFGRSRQNEIRAWGDLRILGRPHLHGKDEQRSRCWNQSFAQEIWPSKQLINGLTSTYTSVGHLINVNNGLP
jgi:hypothetical protein